VYSMATPTIDGASDVLSYLGSKDTSGRSIAQKVVVTDLREEVVVYIKGTPFVLRELDQPVDTLKHVGISGPMVRGSGLPIIQLSFFVVALNFLLCRWKALRQG
jgi:hypothetical protein